MKNFPRWLDVFFGLEKIGMYAVPVNIALRGARFVVIDHGPLPHHLAVENRLRKVERIRPLRLSHHPT
jgi:hypothetical protein